MRFKSFTDHTTAYRNHKKAEKGARIRLDLTKRRLAILLAVRTLNRADLDYAFADSNCNLAAKLRDGKFVFFYLSLIYNIKMLSFVRIKSGILNF